MSDHQLRERSEWLKRKARDHGFSFCGVSKARRLDEEESRLESWLKQGNHGKMGYMANHFEKRLDPRELVPGAKSVISLLYNYHSEQKPVNEDAPKVATYAYGRDYHKVIKKKLKHLMQDLQTQFGAIEGRAFVDSAPVMERQWAALSGIGWTGKNTLLLNKGHGSYFFIADLIIDLEMEADGPVKDYCGTCTACIDACPTDAIKPYQLDASQCISYLTIELKEGIPDDFKGKMEGWAFGCDICQEVCPWNRFSRPHAEPEFIPTSEFLTWNKSQWLTMTREKFEEAFKSSPLKRAGYEKMKNNLQFLFKE